MAIPHILRVQGQLQHRRKECGLSSEPRDWQTGEWRKDLNRAVREFAAALADPEDVPLAAAVRTLLEDCGAALHIDCGSLVELAEDRTPSEHQWHWSVPYAGEHPFKGPLLLSMLQAVDRGHGPVVLQTVLRPGMHDAELAEAGTYLRQTLVHSAAIIPIGGGKSQAAVLILGSVDESFPWGDAVVDHLQMLGEIVAGALAGRRHDPESALRAVPAAPAATTPGHEPSQGMRVPAASRGFDEIIGTSPSLKAAMAKLEEVANTESTVLLLGETGTGKELFARALHARSPRRGAPLISVNCGALPPTLIESELFGHQRGAFTGAVGLRQGRFELAHRGTLFLDEIGDLPPDVQVKLLRVLQEGVFERVGSSHSHSVDVRIIAATHRDLTRAVAEGDFRADLYYRLNVFPIRLPPLRERRGDIPALVWSIIRKRQRAIHRHVTEVPTDVMEALKRHSWPGNIRELENVVERALIHSQGDTLTLLDWSPETSELGPVDDTTLESVERAHIQEVLRECGWKINGLGNAAERLGLHPNTLRFRMKKLGIVRREPFTTVRHPRSLSDTGHRAS
jgi:formate hydrogenlyase transcriptional activator